MQEIQWLDLALIAVALAMLMVTVQLSRQQRKQHLSLENLKQEQRKLECALKTSSDTAIGVGQRLLALETKFKKWADNGNAPSFTSEDLAFSQAIQLFDQGADIETVVNSCGLSSSEASLMAMVRNQLAQPKSKPASEGSGANSQMRDRFVQTADATGSF